MRYIFIGPPGVGKGTQAKQICDHFGIIHLSTGDILRDEISKKSPIGESAQSFIDAGQLVPDDVLLKIMSSRLAQDDCINGFCLDGFPRTIPQAKGLEHILTEFNKSLNCVISIIADEEELVKRLVLRGKSSGRTDDTPGVILQRLHVYREQTEPLIKFYKQQNLVKDVDGIGKINEITERILKTIK